MELVVFYRLLPWVELFLCLFMHGNWIIWRKGIATWSIQHTMEQAVSCVGNVYGPSLQILLSRSGRLIWSELFSVSLRMVLQCPVIRRDVVLIYFPFEMSYPATFISISSVWHGWGSKARRCLLSLFFAGSKPIPPLHCTCLLVSMFWVRDGFDIVDFNRLIGCTSLRSFSSLYHKFESHWRH